jgi:hypothetical protein
MGDVDDDSYGDVAVGAPYSPLADAKGVVYIYYGGPSGLQAARQPQAVWAKGVNGLGFAARHLLRVSLHSNQK